MANEATPTERVVPDESATCSHTHARLLDGEWYCENPYCRINVGAIWLAPAQKFFADLAASIVTPHVGDVYRDAVKSILHRAQEAGLYQPET